MYPESIDGPARCDDATGLSDLWIGQSAQFFRRTKVPGRPLVIGVLTLGPLGRASNSEQQQDEQSGCAPAHGRETQTLAGEVHLEPDLCLAVDLYRPRVGKMLDEEEAPPMDQLGVVNGVWNGRFESWTVVVDLGAHTAVGDDLHDQVDPRSGIAARVEDAVGHEFADEQSQLVGASRMKEWRQRVHASARRVRAPIDARELDV